MKNTYDPTAKAEALARLLGSLRQESRIIKETFPLDVSGYAPSRIKTVEAEIAYLEIIEVEWKQKIIAKGFAPAPLIAKWLAEGLEIEEEIPEELDIQNATVWTLAPKPAPEEIQREAEETPQGTPQSPEILQNESGLAAQEIVKKAQGGKEGQV